MIYGMKKFAIKHPIVLIVIVYIAKIFIFSFFRGVAERMCSPEANARGVDMDIGRLLSGGLLLLVFIRCFNFKKQFSGFVIMLPALLFALWTLLLHFLSKVTNVVPDHCGYAILSGLAPAVLEEIIYRGIFIYFLMANGKKPIAVLLISALFFGLSHITYMIDKEMLSVLFQMSWATVIGLVLGAVYIKTGDLASVIIAHAAVDCCLNLFPIVGCIFPQYVVRTAAYGLMAVETWYAFWLISRKSYSVDLQPPAIAEG